MKKKLISISAAVLVLALVLSLVASCGKEKGEVLTLKIGLVAPLSGPAAAWGVQYETGTKFAVEDFNAAGGIKVGKDTYMMEVVTCDDKMTGSEAAMCATMMAYDYKVKYIVGPIAAVVEAMHPIVHENKIIQIACTGDVYCDYPYFFACGGPPNWAPDFYREFHRLHPEVKTVAVISQDTANAHTFHENTLPVFPELGMELLDTEWTAVGLTDYFPYLTKLLAQNPDALETGWSGPGDQALIMKQARELGFTGWFLTWAYVPVELLEPMVGLDYMYNMATAMPVFTSEYYSPQMRDLNRRYMEEGWSQPGEASMPDVVVHGYSSVTMIVAGIEEAGTIDTDEVLRGFEPLTPPCKGYSKADCSQGCEHLELIVAFLQTLVDNASVHLGSCSDSSY